jgi:hypothetical protein
MSIHHLALIAEIALEALRLPCCTGLANLNEAILHTEGGRALLCLALPGVLTSIIKTRFAFENYGCSKPIPNIIPINKISCTLQICLKAY